MDMGRIMGKGDSGGKWRRYRLLPTAVAAFALLLLVLSGCAAPLSAVSPIPAETASGSTPSSSTPTPGSAAGGTTLLAALTPESPNTSGSGTVRLQLNPEQQQMCFALHVTGIALPATGAHVHRGAVGTTGPIVVHLTSPNSRGVSAGCTHVSSDVISALTQHPADYYVNVHNAPYPDGAVRGQLSTCSPGMNC